MEPLNVFHEVLSVLKIDLGLSALLHRACGGVAALAGVGENCGAELFVCFQLSRQRGAAAVIIECPMDDAQFKY
jgi:hypothetical protein